MNAQLHLLQTGGDPAAPTRKDWRLDESTRAVGRRGVEQARAALRSALRARHDEHPADHASAA